MGYCGGDKEKPSYYNMGDHTEAISIDYDPSVITYSELLGHFWKGHRCEYNNTRVQYMNAVFYRNDEQKELARTALEIRAASLGISSEKVATKILPVKVFTYAEKYHQKYAIRGDIRARMEELGLYPDAKSIADSTVATRLNAYLGSGINQNRSEFLDELAEYGLPEAIEKEVRAKVSP